MFHRALAHLSHHLGNIQTWLDKAEQLAAAKHFDIGVLLHGRLAPDMGAFVYQVQSASDYIKGGAGWLSGQTPPSYADTEQTLDQVRERIRKTVAFVDSVAEAQYRDASAREIAMSWAPEGKILRGDDYLIQMVIPNAYFHMSMAYAILRHHGVDVGKMDFLRPIDWASPRL